jgi:hypothetical protein
MFKRSKFGWVNKMLAVTIIMLGLLPTHDVHAAGTTYYVSTAGSVTNPGTSALPFRNIQQCAQAMTAGDTCVINSGTYRETITPANSGSSGQPIKFQAAPGATVVVSGTEAISGWTLHSGNIYVANISWDLEHNNQLFVKSGTTVTPLWEARWPNINEYTLPELQDGMAYADSGTSTSIVDSDLTQPGNFWNGATIWEKGGDGYQGQTSIVTGYNSTTRTLTYLPIVGDQPYLTPELGTRYYLSGVLGALDMAKEWYVDWAAQKVYLWAPAGGVPSNVEIKKRLHAFNLNNKSFIHLTGIQIFGANIPMSNSNNNVLDGVKVEYPYFSNETHGTTVEHQLTGGINIVGNHNEVKNSTIAYSSGTLINISGDNNRIVNNSIHNGSYLASYDPLVRLSSGISNLISHNEIRDSGRYNIYWTRGSAEIQYNDIYNGMWLSRDGALIYSWGADMGNSEIHHNLIHDSQGEDMSVGLYFDNFTTNVVAHHNVIYKNDVGIQLNTPGNFKLIYNNTVVNNEKSIGYWGSAPYKEELYGTRVYNNIFTDSAELTADTVRGYNTLSDDGINFVNAATHNYRLNAGSTAIHMGAVIPGITDGYIGDAPDAGAYEYGGTDWTAGPNFVSPPSPVLTPIDTAYMNLVKNSVFGGVWDHWTRWTTTTTELVAVPHDGVDAWVKRGYQTKLKLGSGGGVEQLITGLKPDTDYKFVAWVYNNPGETIHVGALNFAGTGSSIDVSSTDTQYTRKEVTFKTGPTNTSARVRIYKSGSATGFSFADDVGLFETTPYHAGVYKNQAKNKTLITSGSTIGNPLRITDGTKDTGFANIDTAGPQWVRIDLGQSYKLDKIKLWHYYADSRTYNDVIVQVSNDPNFATANTKTVFNNDTNNSAGQGIGSDPTYSESASGKEIDFTATNARYVRLWTNGSSVNTSQHYVEVEAWGVPALTPTATPPGYGNKALQRTKITNTGYLGNPLRITDGEYIDSIFANLDDLGPQWIQIDLGLSYNLDEIKVWHYFLGDPRTYKDVIVQVSNDPSFTTKTTVFNNDADNTAGQGLGGDSLYTETSAGKVIPFPVTNARYVRLYSNGNNKNTGNHYVEVEVMGAPNPGEGT